MELALAWAAAQQVIAPQRNCHRPRDKYNRAV